MQANKFQLYQFARLVVILGAEAQALAVSWQVYGITNSALSLGYTGLWLFLPGILFTLLAGHIADRCNRRAVILCSYVGQALFTSALLWISLHPIRSVVPIYVVLFCIGTARCFSGPASSAFLPMLVAEADLVKAITSGATVYQLGNVFGPVLGGILFTVTLPASSRWEGAPIIYGFTLLTILSFLLMVRSLRANGTINQQRPQGSGSLLAGFHFVFQNKLLAGTIMLDILAVLFGGAVALMPIFATEKLHMGPGGLGLLRAMPGVGALAVSMTLFVRPLMRRDSASMFIWMAIFGSATISFGLSRSVSVSVISLLVVGASGMMGLILRTSSIQLATPSEIRGRVSAISWLLSGASNEFGEFESGITAHWFGAAPAVAIGGAMSLFITGIVFLRLSGLRQPFGSSTPRSQQESNSEPRMSGSRFDTVQKGASGSFTQT